jgi:hypothetical protein
MEKYALFEYLYRDASNYKAYGSLLLKGSYVEDERTFLISHLESGQFFVPEAMGIPQLRSQLYSYGGPNDDDHEYHEFVSLRIADSSDIASMELWGTMQEFLLAFAQACKKWLSS